MKAVLPATARPLLDGKLPDDLTVSWWTDAASAQAGIADAAIAWVDMHDKPAMAETLRAAGPALRWVTTIYAGLDTLPLDLLRERGVALTNGVGINAAAVADYAVLGVLAGAKRYDRVVRAQDRREWLRQAPGTIGRMIGERLAAFGVAVTGVTRSGRDGTLGPGEWRGRLGAFDWVVLAAPSTGDTRAMIGATELAAMRPTAWLVNIARGAMIDDAALVDALRDGRIAGAFLDPTHPEPLPPDSPLWDAPNCLLSMHLSGRSQTSMFPRAAALFLDNLAAFRAGAPMRNVADLAAGY